VVCEVVFGRRRGGEVFVERVHPHEPNEGGLGNILQVVTADVQLVWLLENHGASPEYNLLLHGHYGGTTIHWMQ
jgi:hypothetical protein